MKNMVIFLLLLCGCANAGDITGVYTKHVESEYSVGEDTLFITAGDNGRFLLERHTGYQRITNGQLSAKQMKIQHSVIAPSADHQYADTRTGALVSFDGQKLLLGSAEYQKIK